ncbi:MAG: glycoside hydrolase family 3 C-terminal domain-containing protein, partial [Ruminiclostridium sp.]
PVTITEEEPLVDGVLEVWYPGEEGGNAIADILFGDCNPCGRMPVTVVRSIDDLPPFEDYDMYQRTYRYMDKEPLYPFGFGLSYTSFQYSKLKAPSCINAGEDLSLEVTLCNTGKRAGSAALQVYLTDLKATVLTPKHQLVAFRHIFLEKDQSETVTLTIKARQMAVIRNDGSCVLEPGEFLVQVGGVQPDSVSRRLSDDNIEEFIFEMTGEDTQIKY